MARTKKEQETAEEVHRQKCRTTLWMTCSVIFLFLSIIFLATSIGIFTTNELSEYSSAEFKDDCYIKQVTTQSACVTESCPASRGCTRHSYTVEKVEQENCARGECETWSNGCIGIVFTTVCDLFSPDEIYKEGDLVACYVYDDVQNCNNNGRLDPNNEWGDVYTSFAVLLAFGIIFLVVCIVLFVIAFFRCLCKKMDDDLLGSVNGTGCYWCMDYERCCYGEGTGHATVVSPVSDEKPQRKSKPRKKPQTSSEGKERTQKKEDRKQYEKPPRQQKRRDDDDSDVSEDDEEVELR